MHEYGVTKDINAIRVRSSGSGRCGRTTTRHTANHNQNLQETSSLASNLPHLLRGGRGPYGKEAAVGAAGPLLAVLGFLVFPFIWSIPEALVTAELATAFPGNGGYVIWADQAFGPFWGSLMGSWKLLSGVINLASYPALCIQYLKLVFPLLSSGLPHYVAILVSTCVLSFLNYTGLTIVGYTAVTLGVFSLSPFVILVLFAIPRIDFKRWLCLGQKGVEKDWTLFFNTLFWNLNFWDNASTLAGEVEEPQRTYPKALFSAAGKWLKICVEIGACLSIVGLYEAQLSSCAYQILGVTDLGFLPQVFGMRSRRFDTPWVGILISTLVALAVSYMEFANIISCVNFLYSLGMLLEFASFLWLRRKLPTFKRPFRVPLELPGLVVLSLVPSGFLVYVMVVATKTVYLVSALLTLFGIFWYFFMNLCKSKMWFEFNIVGQKYNNGDID
ncbi:hypothetical protein Dsin_018967 [Dipteronia sinensis]|uniref:Uncharacterized protein n=1 Tax=Dipteronia sinensis TaxID=43782 RepID=A0AAE0A6G2_9ROSI|nr:hypothetical protein Dsin_018967 [Dipteronia sinensis]